jgi:pre-mRNA-splicing factor ATP-dependent RNA helicase DHX38/PRP16
VFYSVREKSFDERGNRRKADREFSRKAEIEAEMARQREECVLSLLFVRVSSRLLTRVVHRTAKAAKQEELAKSTASGGKSQIIMPGTPRHAGIGAGSRVTATPRRRGGI